MVEILKDAKDDFSIKDLLNKLRKWSRLPRGSTDAAACSKGFCYTHPAVANEYICYDPADSLRQLWIPSMM